MEKINRVHMLQTDTGAAMFQSKEHPEMLQKGDNSVDNPYWQGQHFYWTDDSEPQGWVLSPTGNVHHSDDKCLENGCRKITATTNNALWWSKDEAPEMHGIPAGKTRLIAAIPDSFIDAYIAAKNAITEVIVVYDDIRPEFNGLGELAWKFKTLTKQDFKDWYFRKDRIYFPTPDEVWAWFESNKISFQ